MIEPAPCHSAPGANANADQASLCRLVISVFGGIGLRFASRDLPLANRKARALLAYLALSDEPGSAQREHLAGLLWPESSEHHARASLRQVLSDVRDALGTATSRILRAGRTEIALAAAEIELDWTAVRRHIEAGRVPEILLSTPRAADGLLAGYEDLSPALLEWLRAQRARIKDQLLRGLARHYRDETLSRRERRLMAEAALTLDPTDEEACRVAMRLAAEGGEIGPALRAYATLYEVLGDELDMEPSAPTQALVAEIKQGKFDPAPSRAARAMVDVGARSVPALPHAGAPSVAVLPFRPLGPDPVPGFFAEGIVDDVVRTLATLREPVVISSNSTREFRGCSIDLHEVGGRLGVQYVVSGTIRMAGPQLRLSVELVEAASGVVLWAGAYDARGPEFFEAQDDIASSVARTLVPRLRDAELRRSRGRRPEDLAAYHLLLHARELTFRLERTAFEEAGALLRLAIDRDPGYAAARAAAANWYSLRIGQGWSSDPESDLVSLEAMARSAIAMDSANGRALAMLAHNRTILRREYDEALAMLDRALEAAPNDAEALIWSSPTFAYVGEPAEAVRRAERAISLSPEDPFMFRYEHFLAIAHYAAAEYDEAVHWGTRSARANPHYTSNLRLTAAALAGIGRADEARPLIDRVLELQPGFRVSPMMARQAFRSEVRETFARHLIEAGLPP